MSALICGSVAYDTIMVFPGLFRDHILPDKVHMLNVSFLAPEMRREFGGCAGNVAYNLRLLGAEGYPLGTVGSDFAPYAQWLERHGVSRRYLQVVEGSYTAQAFITSDLDDNQITAFHPGAMSHSQQVEVPADAGIRIGMVSPDSREGMLAHAAQFRAAGIPFVFDPGQALPLFDGPDLLGLIEQAEWMAVNDYECELVQSRTGQGLEALASRLQALVVTRGAEGSRIHVGGEVISIPAAPVRAVVDPTGCGDAYRAGLLYGLLEGLDWERTGRIASLLGAIKIEHAGTQNHHFSRPGFAARYHEAWGHAPW